MGVVGVWGGSLGVVWVGSLGRLGGWLLGMGVVGGGWGMVADSCVCMDVLWGYCTRIRVGKGGRAMAEGGEWRVESWGLWWTGGEMEGRKDGG